MGFRCQGSPFFENKCKYFDFRDSQFRASGRPAIIVSDTNIAKSGQKFVLFPAIH